MLNWSAVSGSHSGFNVYRRIKGDSDYHKLNSMLLYNRSFVDTTVISDTVYFYTVASYLVSAPSLEGAYSEEASAETRKVPMELSQNEYTTPANGEIVIPVGISDLKGNSISSVSLKISVNPNVLECVEASIAGAAEGWTDFTYYCNANGEIWINMSGAVPLSGNGTLVEVKYRVTGSIGDTSSIRIIDCILNNGLPQVKTAKALVTVGTPSHLPSQPGSVQVELRNYPNPFSRSTTIEYTHPDLQAGTRVILDVYNLNMVKVTSHMKHMHMAGTYRER